MRPNSADGIKVKTLKKLPLQEQPVKGLHCCIDYLSKIFGSLLQCRSNDRQICEQNWKHYVKTNSETQLKINVKVLEGMIIILEAQNTGNIRI